jgi:hypothetical protein
LDGATGTSPDFGPPIFDCCGAHRLCQPSQLWDNSSFSLQREGREGFAQAGKAGLARNFVTAALMLVEHVRPGKQFLIEILNY